MHTIEDVVRVYVTKRDNLRALKARHDEEQAALKAELKTMETWLLRETQRAGVTGYKTPFGTVFHATSASATVEDWDQVLSYVREHDAFGLLIQGVNKAAVKTMLEAGGRLPPGIKYAEILGVQIRKS